MAVVTDLRLPGVYFLPPVRVAGLGLPPLDVARLHRLCRTWAVESAGAGGDLDAYWAVFGGDMPVVRHDRRRGRLRPSAGAGGFLCQWWAPLLCRPCRRPGGDACAPSARGLVALNGMGQATRSRCWPHRPAAGPRACVWRRVGDHAPALGCVHSRQRLHPEFGNWAVPAAVQPGDSLQLTFAASHSVLKKYTGFTR